MQLSVFLLVDVVPCLGVVVRNKSRLWRDRRVGGYFVLALNNHHRRLFISPRIHRSSTSAFRPFSDEWGIVMIPHLTYLGCVALVYEC